MQQQNNTNDSDGHIGKELRRSRHNDGLNIWSLNVRSLNTESRIQELEEEAKGNEKGILLIQETWRNQARERLNIGSWKLYGTGCTTRPRGNGTAIMVHNTIKVESCHHIDPRITAIRIPYGKQHLLVVSAYAPVHQGNKNALKTERFYAKLTTITNEARNKGDVVIIGGDINAHIKQASAPGLLGKWSSNKEVVHVVDLIAFMT